MTNRKLISLANFNNSKARHIVDADSNEPVLNGIECPICERELMDSSPMTVLLSHPPKKHVKCYKCNYEGYRYV